MRHLDPHRSPEKPVDGSDLRRTGGEIDDLSAFPSEQSGTGKGERATQLPDGASVGMVSPLAQFGFPAIELGIRGLDPGVRVVLGEWCEARLDGGRTLKVVGAIIEHGAVIENQKVDGFPVARSTTLGL